MNTITPNDFSVELKINREDYDSWHENIFDKKGRTSPAIAFKKVISKKIESLLLTYRDMFDQKLSAIQRHCSKCVMEKGTDRFKERTEMNHIADIQFAYNNQELI